MVKWGNGFFGDFFGGRLISRGKPKKNLKKKCLSLNYSSGHNFGPTECCKSLHRTFMDAWLNGDFKFFFEKIISRIFVKITLGHFWVKNSPTSIENFVDEIGFFANFFGFSMEDISQWAYDLLTAHAVPRIFLCSKSNIPRGCFGVKISRLHV